MKKLSVLWTKTKPYTLLICRFWRQFGGSLSLNLPKKGLIWSDSPFWSSSTGPQARALFSSVISRHAIFEEICQQTHSAIDPVPLKKDCVQYNAVYIEAVMWLHAWASTCPNHVHLIWSLCWMPDIAVFALTEAKRSRSCSAWDQAPKKKNWNWVQSSPLFEYSLLLC